MTPDDEGPASLDINTEAKVVPLEVRPPVTRRLAAWWLVLAVALAAFVLLLLDQLRHGMVVLGSALWLGAGLRAVLPTERAGGLVVRSRRRCHSRRRPSSARASSFASTMRQVYARRWPSSSVAGGAVS